jgi:uncharacterized protein (DUF427 family)
MQMLLHLARHQIPMQTQMQMQKHQQKHLHQHLRQHLRQRVPRSIRCNCNCNCIDDPGGHKSRFDKLINKRSRLTPEDVRNTLFRRTNRVWDCDLVCTDRYYFVVLPDTWLPDTESVLYMRKLQDITSRLNSWNVADIVSDALEGLERSTIRVGEPNGGLMIDLCISASRRKEFE